MSVRRCISYDGFLSSHVTLRDPDPHVAALKVGRELPVVPDTLHEFRDLRLFSDDHLTVLALFQWDVPVLGPVDLAGGFF